MLLALRLPGLCASTGAPSERNAAQAAFFTRPERMQAVQTRTCLRTPSITAFTRRRFGFHRRRRTLWALLMVFPKLGFLPQISHTSAIDTLLPTENFERIRIFMLPEIAPRWKLFGCFSISHRGFAVQRGETTFVKKSALGPTRRAHILQGWFTSKPGRK